jgi:hypothetical protein
MADRRKEQWGRLNATCARREARDRGRFNANNDRNIELMAEASRQKQSTHADLQTAVNNKHSERMSRARNAKHQAEGTVQRT